MEYLLDSNILVAILDPDYTFHYRCQDWIESTGYRHWHTCPTTQNGVIKVMCGPKYQGGRQRPDEPIARFESLLMLGRHEFLADELSMPNSQVFNRERLRGTKQITDTYLLGLATSVGITLATMARRIDPNTVHGDADHLLMLD